MHRTTTYAIVLFIVLFLISTVFYTGGSSVDVTSTTFSWIHNYWCDLIWPTGYRGESNSASWLAIPAMFILCIGISILFYTFPAVYKTNALWTKIIRIFGTSSMILAALLFTPLHDIVIPMASLCALVALVGIFIVLHQNKSTRLFNFGLFCMFLLLLNNLIYYFGTEDWLYYLPILQKVSIFIVLLWVIAVDLSKTSTINSNLSPHE